MLACTLETQSALVLLQVYEAAQVQEVSLTVPVALGIFVQLATHFKEALVHVQFVLHIHELIPLLVVAPGINGQSSWQVAPFQK